MSDTKFEDRQFTTQGFAQEGATGLSGYESTGLFEDNNLDGALTTLKYLLRTRGQVTITMLPYPEPTLQETIAAAPVGTMWSGEDSYTRLKVTDTRYLLVGDTKEDNTITTYPIGWLNSTQPISEIYTITEPAL